MIIMIISKCTLFYCIINEKVQIPPNSLKSVLQLLREIINQDWNQIKSERLLKLEAPMGIRGIESRRRGGNVTPVSPST